MNKKVLMVILTTIVLLASGFGVYYYFATEDKSTTLTKIEREWIDANKQDLIDLGVSNNIPVFNYVGEGIIFDFFTDLEKNTDLEFNRISHSYNDQIDEAYSFKMVKNISDKQIVVYEDTYALFTLKNEKYFNLKDIKNIKIGVLESDLNEIKNYFSTCENCSFITYKTIAELIVGVLGSETKISEVDAIVAPQLLTMEKVLAGKLYNNYLINEVKTNYVISLGNVDKLNNIIKKYYKKWAADNFRTKFNKYFTDCYFEFSGTDQNSMAAFKGKRYNYGYIENGPYDMTINNTLYGTNKAILNKFSEIADIEIVYEKYNNIEELIKGFNDGKVDVFFNNTNQDGYKLNGFISDNAYVGQIAIISNIDTAINISSLRSLEDKKIGVLKNSNVELLMNEYHAKPTTYVNIIDLLNSESELLAIDFTTYEFYHKNILENYKLEYIYNLEEPYGYTMSSVSSNLIFNQYFNFYLRTNSQNLVIGEGINEINSKLNTKAIIRKVCVSGGLILIFVGSILLTSQLNKSKKPNISFKKTEKIKYMDMLTSLKNRNYLNDNIEKWDNSQVYPQTILIVDLNNIAYINDNYGHNAGDDEIKEAANVLIKNQVINSDIVRTNGNEFLVYLVGYEEKQVELYIKKLNKELKDLKHGFGAAIGYSMIVDDIKTIDDAINEATIEMRKIKEENNDQKDV